MQHLGPGLLFRSRGEGPLRGWREAELDEPVPRIQVVFAWFVPDSPHPVSFGVAITRAVVDLAEMLRLRGVPAARVAGANGGGMRLINEPCRLVELPDE